MVDFSTLNDAQRRAVQTLDGPLLVLAGAGSGKTRVITYRLANLIHEGIAAKNILCVTFTNKAAHEMRARARKLVGKQVRGTTMSTFHALGVRILRESPEAIGLKPGFTITDSGEQMGFVRRILRDLRIDGRNFDAKVILNMISMAKNAGLSARQYRAQRGHLLPVPEGPLEGPGDGAPDHDYTVAAIEIYDKYESGLRAQNVVDFDDLLLLTVQLLKSNPDRLDTLRDRWRYVMVDEYQDTNGAQFELVHLLSAEHKNLCVVGDDDQSIYGWRGADVTNILRFDKQFEGAKVIKLETNYRSTGHILNVANSVIAKNTQRHDKKLRAFAGEGDVVRIVATEDEEVESEQIASVIFDLLSTGVLAKEVAVLFRSNVQSRALELAFRALNIPYVVAGGMDLLERREVKDVVAYLKLLNNLDDEQSLRRVINFPPRGIGATAIAKLESWAGENRVGMFEAMTQAYEIDGLKEKSANAVSTFVELINEHRKMLKRCKVSTVVERLFEAIKIEDVLFESSDNGQVASRRVDNIRGIRKQIKRFEERNLKDKRRDKVDGEEIIESNLSEFLSSLALDSTESNDKKEDRDHAVVLSTIHAAKGLEWKHVFLVGAEEDILPHSRTLDSGGEIEEERRLAYVAITRAREQLTISWARSRAKWGKILPRTRSRFVEELPEESVRYEDGEMTVERTEDESAAHAQKHLDAIRAKLGL